MSIRTRVVPCLWFDQDAEAAAELYTGVFPNSRIVNVRRYPNAGRETHGQSAGAAMTVDFEIDGLHITALNGGPHFKFNEAVSLQVMCETQDEIDHHWQRLGEGGDPAARQCGWLKDRFGLSWQIVPIQLAELFSTCDAPARERLMKEMLSQKKLDIARLQQAAAG